MSSAYDILEDDRSWDDVPANPYDEDADTTTEEG